MRKFSNEVLVIGGDHHNTLAAIRCFSREKVPIKILIHGNYKNVKEIRISHSKYINNNIFFIEPNEKSIAKWLKDNKTNQIQIIFTCSDLAEYTVDNNYSILKESYITFGFKNSPGRVAKLMNKFEQKKWADLNNIPMAKTWKLSKQNNKFVKPSEITYPCIVKPLISAFGEKRDIRIVDNQEDFYEILKIFNESQYSDLLVQEFIKKDYELCAHGCIISDKSKYYGCVIKKIREYPARGGGSLTLAKFITDTTILNEIEKCIFKLYDEGYRGMYDIEYLVCGEKIYLNEINFRHSGNGYALIKNGIKAPFIWYLNTIGETEYGNTKLIRNNAYHMDEIGEWNLYKSKDISTKELIKDIAKSFAYARIDLRDLSGSLSFFSEMLKQKIKRRLKRE